ncbi:spore germination protein D [Gracilibacillus ureilyticus]|uniref:Spore germination protein D n=1 Tax=Gracilibacillus ureilyticus TaxID=531814 RepID=A0A1H9VGQ9_9BACI|nr:spore germination lipoprotein GerD [Gracilibacillus ureilyticus]SES20749.1 spore germination protein D [Gracilibacillus ureilyticus]
MKRIKLTIYFITILVLLTACGGSNNEGQEEGNYEGTKKMVADILKTDEGKKAITEVLASDDMQQTYVIDAKIVKDSVESALSSDKGKEYWTKMFQDPKFVESFALALQEQQEKVMKNLMSDPEYQSKLIEIFSNPDMEKQTLTVLTGQEFRSHLEKVMEETFSSPIFQAKIAELLMNAAKEMKPSGEGGGGEGQSDGGGSSEGGQGGQQQEGGGSQEQQGS